MVYTYYISYAPIPEEIPELTRVQAGSFLKYIRHKVYRELRGGNLIPSIHELHIISKVNKTFESVTYYDGLSTYLSEDMLPNVLVSVEEQKVPEDKLKSLKQVLAKQRIDIRFHLRERII